MVTDDPPTPHFLITQNFMPSRFNHSGFNAVRVRKNCESEALSGVALVLRGRLALLTLLAHEECLGEGLIRGTATLWGSALYPESGTDDSGSSTTNNKTTTS